MTRLHWKSLWFAWVMLFALVSSTVLAQDNLRDSQLIQDLKQIPANPKMRIEGKCKVVMASGGSKEKPITKNFELAVFDGLLKSAKETVSPPGKEIRVLNDRYLFALLGGDEKFSVVYLERNDSTVHDLIAQQIKGNEPLSAALYGVSIAGSSISEFVKSDRFELLRIESMRGDGGNELVKMHFSYAFDEKAQISFGLEPSWVLMDRSKNFFILESHLNSISGAKRDKIVYHAKLVPGIECGEIWLAKEIVLSVSFNGGEATVDKWENEFTELSSMDQFYLSAYGFPEPIFSEKGIAFWLWLLVVSLGILIGSILLKNRFFRSAERMR